MLATNSIHPDQQHDGDDHDQNNCFLENCKVFHPVAQALKHEVAYTPGYARNIELRTMRCSEDAGTESGLETFVAGVRWAVVERDL